MTPKIIRTPVEYETVRVEAARLVALDPPVGTSDADRLELLAVLLADYEKKHFPLPDPDPTEAIRFRMEQEGLTQQDLVPFIGSKSRVSEVLAGRRRLTLPMIRELSTGLGIPLRVLIQPDVAPRSISGAAMVRDWKRFPLREMAKRGYFGTLGNLRAIRGSGETLIRQFLAPLESRGHPMLAKQSHHIRSDQVSEQYALFAWSARVIRQALASGPAEGYRPGIVDDEFMRQVARLSWSAQGPILAREFLSRHGISLIIERHLPKTYLDGAALLLDLGHPVIGMTLRYDRLDNFWHCLMHELAHLRLHLLSEGVAFYDDLDPLVAEGDARETEADELAREALVPLKIWKASAASTVRSPDAAISLARRLNVHPSVVAGRMRYEAKDFTILSSLLGHVREVFPEYHSRKGM